MPLDAVSLPAGKNFAPVRPLQHAREAAVRGGYSSVASIFREICQQIEMEDELPWRQHLAQGEVVAQLRNGKLIIKRDLSGDGYVFLKPTPQRNLQDRSNYPVFPSISEDLKAKWEKARPQVSARAFGDGYKTEIQLATLDRVARSYFKSIFDSPYELNEALSAQDFGTYVTRFWYDEGHNPMSQLMPVLADSSTELHPGYGACLNCGHEGVPSDFAKTKAPMPQCPECESYNTTQMVPPAIAAGKNVVDVEKITQGDIRGALLKVPASKFDLRGLAQDSGYFRYQQFIPWRYALQTFGDLNYIMDDGANDDTAYGLDIIEALASKGGNTEGLGASDLYFAGGARLRERVIMKEYWLKPEMYAGYQLRMDEDTVSGKIPADVPFEEIWPDGVCLQGFNNNNLVTGIYAEKARIVSSNYYVMSFSGLGKGLSDGVDIAKDINEIYSMAMADVKRHGASGVTIDKSLGLTQSEARRMFRPEGVVFVDAKKKGFANVNEAVQKLQFPTVNEALPNMIVQQANLLNLVSLSGDFSEGTLQQVDINTLGGQQLATAKEEGKKGAILSMKSFHRTASATHICELVREHTKFARYFPGDKEAQGRTKGKWISGADLPEHIDFDTVPESTIAQSEYERKLAVREFIKDAGGILVLAQLIQAQPKTVAWYAAQFGAEIPELNQEEIWTVCLERLDNIKSLSAMDMTTVPSDILAQLDKPLYLDENNHLLKADFVAEVLDDDEFMDWPQNGRGAVQLLIKTHRDLARAQQLDNEMREQNAQLALQQRGQQMMQPPPQEVAAQAAGQAVGAAAGAVAQHALGQDAANADHARNMERDQAAGDRQLQLAQVKEGAAQTAGDNQD